MKEDQRIVTRCPSCGGQTLFIGKGGHLTCSLLICKQPSVDAAVDSLKQTLASIERIAGQWRPRP